MTDGISKEALEQASKLIEAGLEKGKEEFVKLSQGEMRKGMDVTSVLVEQELNTPRINKDALEAASQLISERESKFATLDKDTMKKGLEACALIVDRVKGEHSAKFATKPPSHGRTL